MRRMILPAALVTALTLALAGPASAASTRVYIGDVAPSGTVGFELKPKKGKNGKKKVKDFTFLDVPIVCDEGDNEASGQITFKMKVKQKKFEGEAAADAGGELQVAGTVRKRGSEGNLRVSGSAPLDDGTTGTNCDTGKLSWNADRV
jgi:hypothetical protein